jgi:multimeric flavodoxin WrbA
MKVLLLCGSGRADGNTARTVGLFREKLERVCGETGIELEVETVLLGQEQLQFCRGCRACFDEDRCPLKDGLIPLRDRMLEADALVVGSPVYVEDVSGLTKNWIDRMAFFCHRPGLYGKCAWLITTSASRSTKHSLRTMSVALTTWGAKVCGGNRLFLGALSSKAEIAAKYGAALEKAARGLLRAVQSQSATKPSMFSLITFRVQQTYWRRVAGDSYDLKYWTEKGRLEHGCGYYGPYRTGAVKRCAADLAAKFVSAIFK